jgi:sigma-B regulation protein RsbU (phosphoserine phosphatase)
MNDPFSRHLTFPATEDKLAESLSAIRRYAIDAARAADLEDKALYRLRLALDEIATNIILYAYADTDDGVIDVRATLDDDTLTIVLEDTGVPYDPLQRELPSSLGTPIEEREIGGMGIYLAVVNVDNFSYERVGNRNRNIFVMNRPSAPPAPKTRKRESLLEFWALESPGHLLIADDNDIDRNTLARHLENQGFRVQTATDGQETLDILRAQPFDLLLLDLALPVLGGIQVLEQIKTDAQLHYLPVLIVSRSARVEDAVCAIEGGASDYLHKPPNLQLLDARVKACLDEKRQYDAQQRQLAKYRKLANHMEQVILPMAIALSTETDFNHLLERVVAEARTICNADGGTLYMRSDDDMLYFRVIISDSLGLKLGVSSEQSISLAPLPLYDPKTGEPNCRNVSTYVALFGEAINIPDVYQVEGFDFSGTRSFDREHNTRTVSNLTVPIKDNEGKVIAVLQLINAQDEQGTIVAFDDYSQLVVESLASQIAVVINNHLLLQRQIALVKLENDIQTARNIQINFLPSQMPEVPGYEVAARFHPAREVAGDFYDAFMMMNNRKLGLVIADICDKGVGAALFMSLTRSLIRAFAIGERNVNWALDILETGIRSSKNSVVRDISANILMTAIVNTNKYITEHHLDLTMFATTFFGMLDPLSGQLCYINGGHCPPMLLSSEGEIKARLKPTGPAIGIFPGATFKIEEVWLEPGDILLTFTDGVTDARNLKREQFGESGIITFLQPPVLSASELLDRIETGLRQHAADTLPFDDVTMLVVRRK